MDRRAALIHELSTTLTLSQLRALRLDDVAHQDDSGYQNPKEDVWIGDRCYNMTSAQRYHMEEYLNAPQQGNMYTDWRPDIGDSLFNSVTGAPVSRTTLWRVRKRLEKVTL